MNDDLLESVEKSLKQNINDFQKKQKEKKKQIDAEQAKRAEEYFFAMKIAQRAKVKSIFRLKPNPELEEKLIDDFIKYPLANPTQYTLAMEGKPFVVLVSMDNGIKYRAAMTRLIYIEWPKESIQNQQIMKQKLLGNNLNKPTIYADKIEYALLLWPLHKNAKVDENDFIDVRWHENDDIINFQEKEGKDTGDGIYTVGGTHLGGTSVCTGSFELLNGIYGLREKYPRHFHQLFGAVQKSYDFARQQNSLGKVIYTLLDPTKPARGRGWTIPILPTEKRIYFEVPEVKVVNPNQPLRIIHKQPTLQPQRIKIDPPIQLMEKGNIHD